MALLDGLQPRLLRRDDSSDAAATQSRTIVVAVIVAVAGLAGLTLGAVVMWRRRKSKDRHRRLASTDDSELQLQQSETTTTTATTQRQPSNGTNAPVSHRLSTRSIASIMTLPPYKEQPGETEEIIAREGEREGLDYIVEGPETAEELEARRQEEVAAIYRVQQTRRRELEERAERRRARRAALDRQDYREVARLDRAAAVARQRERNMSSTSVGQASQASGHTGASSVTINSNASTNALSAVVEGAEPSSGELLAELQELRSRGRRVSSVTYSNIGTQRHDGSRLRATSIDSDSAPLLDSAAALGRDWADMRSSRSRASSVGSNNTQPGGGGDADGRERSRSRASRNGPGDDMRQLSLSLGEDGIPPDPPSYDDDLSVHAGDAPRYEDVVLESPRQSADIVAGDVHRTASHEEEQEEEEERVERTMPPPAPSAVPLRLQTGGIVPPSIDIISATPTQSRPHSALSLATTEMAETRR